LDLEGEGLENPPVPPGVLADVTLEGNPKEKGRMGTYLRKMESKKVNYVQLRGKI
jgi:hypothetical protein